MPVIDVFRNETSQEAPIERVYTAVMKDEFQFEGNNSICLGLSLGGNWYLIWVISVLRLIVMLYIDESKRV